MTELSPMDGVVLSYDRYEELIEAATILDSVRMIARSCNYLPQDALFAILGIPQEKKNV